MQAGPKLRRLNEKRRENISKQTVDVCIKIAENISFVVVYLQFFDPETPVSKV